MLVDGDVVVYDSTLILEYLEDRHPQPPLLAADAAGRARCRQWEAAADELLFPHIWDLIEESFYPSADGAARDTARLDGARAGVDAYQAQLEKELLGRPFLCGDAFSFADIGNYVLLGAAATLGVPPVPGRTALTGWAERVGSRPAVRRDQEAMQAFVRELLG